MPKLDQHPIAGAHLLQYFSPAAFGAETFGAAAIDSVVLHFNGLGKILRKDHAPACFGGIKRQFVGHGGIADEEDAEFFFAGIKGEEEKAEYE